METLITTSPAIGSEPLNIMQCFVILMFIIPLHTQYYCVQATRAEANTASTIKNFGI